MIGRSVPEWHGKTLDDPVPTRVRMRVWERDGRSCKKCTRIIRSGDRWVCDHTVAIINGGPNRENNLQTLCWWCRPNKDADDVALKSDNYRIRVAHFGQREPRGRPMPGTRRSGLKKKLDGTVERRK